VSGFSARRRKKIRKILTEYIKPFVRTDQPNALEQFLQETEYNIAIYIGQRTAEQASALPPLPRRAAFDRKKAQNYLRKASNTVCAAQKDLRAIAGWPELSSFFERLSVQVGKWTKGQTPNSLLHQIRLIEKANKERHLLQAVQPKYLAGQLFQLEPLLIIAIERIARQSDADAAALNFVNAMASAWFDATGILPTSARRSIRSLRQSPFTELLQVINQKIFRPKVRSPNNFFQYAVKSVSFMKELHDVSRRSRRSRSH
jgi:hypothetical protein